MKTATVRQLRHDFGAVLNWVEEGEPVEISKRGKIVALLTPPPAPKPARSRKRPDFAARLKYCPCARGRNPAATDSGRQMLMTLS